MRQTLRIPGLVSLLTLFVAMFALCAAPEVRAAQTSISLVNLAGTVDIGPAAAGGTWVPARPSTALNVGDTVRTGADGSALLKHGACELYLKPDSTTVIGYTSVQMRQGSLWFRMRKDGSNFKFVTDVASATIRGTKGLLVATPDLMTVSLLEGKVEVESENNANYMLMPLHEVTARRRAPLDVSTLSGSRAMQLHRDFYAGEKALGAAPGSGSGSSGSTGSAAPSQTGSQTGSLGALDTGSTVYDPAAARARGAVSVRPAGPPPLITVIDNTAPTPVRALPGVPGSATSLVPVVTTLVGGATGAAADLTSTVVSTVGSTVGTVGGTVGSVVGTVGNTVGSLTGTVGSTVGIVGSTVGSVVGTVGNTVGAVGGTVGSTLGSVGNTVGGTVGGVAGTVGNTVGGVTGSLGGTLGGLGGALGGLGGFHH